jgi:threonine/homoserine/homoserine lactone efflux protein
MIAFLVVAAVVIVTPGQDTALTIRKTLSGGRRAGALTALGVSTGQAVAVGLIVYALTLAVSLLGAPAFAVGSRSRAVSV